MPRTRIGSPVFAADARKVLGEVLAERAAGDH